MLLSTIYQPKEILNLGFYEIETIFVDWFDLSKVVVMDVREKRRYERIGFTPVTLAS